MNVEKVLRLLRDADMCVKLAACGDSGSFAKASELIQQARNAMAEPTDQPNVTLDAYRTQLVATIRERDEYYNRAVSLLAFVPGDVAAGQLQKMRDDFAAWRAAIPTDGAA